MRNIILFIFMFLSIGIKAQSYDDSNVHYYLPVGYSVEDVGNTRHPYSTASMLYVTVIIERGNNIYCSNTGNWSFEIKRNRDKCISSINSGIRNASNIGSYNSRLSTSKYEVYSKSVPSSMWGSGYTRYNAISKDYKEYITWDDSSGADKRKRYYEIDINELLPKSVENYDFLE